MKFINRQEELKLLEEYYHFSKRKQFLISISGLRRVGKTTLIREFIKNKKSLYFFIYDYKSSKDLLFEFTEELRINKIITELEKIYTWTDFFQVIYSRCKNYVVVFDEFQNLYNIDKSIFSIFQKHIDENQNTQIMFVVLGSLIGLLKKILEDKKEPLYGRINYKIKLKPFTLKDTILAMKELKYKDPYQVFYIYSVFGGFPKYYSILEDLQCYNYKYDKVIEKLFLVNNAPLESEVNDILKQEFGKRSSLYYSILFAISLGNTKLNEIATFTNTKTSSITRHLLDLEQRFEIIKTVKPINNKKSTRYYIKHPLLKFWFKFIYSKFSQYNLKETDLLLNEITKDYNSYFGRSFEEISKDYLINLNLKNALPFSAENINNWWGYKRLDKQREAIEIDLILTNENEEKIMFVECKWKDNVSVESVLSNLKEKTKFVNWKKDKRKEYYCIIAKSFKNKNSSEDILLFDFKDIQKEYF